MTRRNGPGRSAGGGAKAPAGRPNAAKGAASGPRRPAKGAAPKPRQGTNAAPGKPHKDARTAVDAPRRSAKSAVAAPRQSAKGAAATDATPKERAAGPAPVASADSPGAVRRAAASAKRAAGPPKGDGGARSLTQRVKTAKGRKLSSTLWIQRQLNDPYVQAARAAGYRSRAAYKLIEIDDRYKILKPGQTIVDLGAAPGGWSQVAAQRVRVSAGSPIVAVDILPMDHIDGVTILTADFNEDATVAALIEALGSRRPDIVLSDLAPETTGHRSTDHLRIVALLELAHDFARKTLAPGGTFLAKVYQGGTEGDVLTALRRDFRTVRHVKPPASRSGSPETYVLATGFRGGA